MRAYRDSFVGRDPIEPPKRKGGLLAAVFVGGTSVFGGRGSIWGTFLGAFMIGGITAGILAAGWADFWTNVIYGAIILVSVSIHAILQRRFQR